MAVASPQYEIHPRVVRQAAVATYGADPDAPVTRPLQIYTLDPSLPSRLGGVATVQVPYEKLTKGPVGTVFAINPAGKPFGTEVEPLDLDDPRLLMTDGLTPSPDDPRFHLQMVYAVCSLTYAVFRRALGREIVWSHAGQNGAPAVLSVSPFASRKRNAGFSSELGVLDFGYFSAGKDPAGFTIPGGLIFTALSHDVIVHETTHALLDAIRPSFLSPSHPDVLGFHEGFADIVALLMHFSYPGVVERAIADTRGNFTHAKVLSDLAQEFGYARSTAGNARPLRSAIDVSSVLAFDSDLPPGATNSPAQYSPTLESHAMGSVLAAAVFEAFTTIVRRKSERLMRIAGLAPDQLNGISLNEELVRAIAAEASTVASHFLTICIRALDYCPPVDMELGEYLRAIITADQETVRHDPWGYREALMRSFRRRKIFPHHVQFMTEGAVRWQRPTERMAIPELAFSNLRFGRDPGYPASAKHLTAQAEHVGRFVSRPEIAAALHLIAPGAKRPAGIQQSSPMFVDSVRSARRVSPDGQIVFDLVAEVTQTCTAVVDGVPFDFVGGCTLVIGPDGEVRYAIYKRLDSKNRRARQAAAIKGALRVFWKAGTKVRRARGDVLSIVHARKG